MKSATFIFHERVAQFRDQADSPEAWDEKWSQADISRQLIGSETGFLGVYRRGFEKYMPKYGMILEAGCGSGRYVKALQKNGYNIIGVDWAQNTLIKIKGVWKEAPFIIGEINYLPLPSASISAVISLGVIEHFLNPWILLEDFKRVLKPSGILYLVVPYENYLKKYNKKKGKYLPRNDAKDFYQFHFDQKEIEFALNNSGYSVIDSYATSGYTGLADEWKVLDRIFQLVPFSHHLINFLNRSYLLGSISGHVIHMVGRKP